MYSILQPFEQAKKVHLTEFESKNSKKKFRWMFIAYLSLS